MLVEILSISKKFFQSLYYNSIKSKNRINFYIILLAIQTKIIQIVKYYF